MRQDQIQKNAMLILIFLKYQLYILSKKYRELVNKTQNYSLFIQIYFIAVKLGPSRNYTIVPTNNPIIKTFFKRIFPN